jgi:hypothetical protein
MRVRVILSILFLALGAWAQEPTPVDAQQLASKQFGAGFSVVKSFTLMTGDLNGDGVEDAVLVATCKSPLDGEEQYDYRVIDPYHAYFGWGDPKVTQEFSVQDAVVPPLLLIMHSWREAAPRKFVVMNLPFEKVSVVQGKKRWMIRVLDNVGISSVLHWDGRKYKWSPGR